MAKMLMPRSNRQFEKIKQQLTITKTREKKTMLQNENLKCKPICNFDLTCIFVISRANQKNIRLFKATWT